MGEGVKGKEPAIPKRILAMDIGSGTQDILIYEEGVPMENCVQMVLPSPTQMAARKISAATAQKKEVFLFGNLMGGGPCAWAVKKHLGSGLKVYATESAALTIRDNLDEVRQQGVQITSGSPRGALRVRLRDVDLSSLKKVLKFYQIELPSAWAIAVQDHGFNPRESNRRFRFQYWERFLLGGGQLSDLIYRTPPPSMTRMMAVQRDAPGSMIMDTCAAAIWGILCDSQVKERAKEGILAVNLGNQHTLGALIQGRRVWGIFEHHTGRVTREKLRSILKRFPKNLLSNEEIFNDGGHGCALHPEFPFKKGTHFFVAVTGPKRALAEGLGYHMAAPYGNMMLTGCFGLIAAVKAKLTAESAENAEDIRLKAQ